MPSYFKRYYLDDVKLAQRALLEFHRSLCSGRMIAFTGSMTTESCGYGSWEDLVDAYARVASQVKEQSFDPNADLEKLLAAEEAAFPHHPSIARVLGYRKDGDGNSDARFDVRVALGLMEEVVIGHEELRDRILPKVVHRESGFDTIDQPVHVLSVALARYFRRPHREKKAEDARDALKTAKPRHPADAPDVVGALLRGLGIRRFATLNYDFELERQTMLTDVPHDPKSRAEAEHREESPFEKLVRLRSKSTGEVFDWMLDSGRIRRVLVNGQAIESDILNRERIDRMIEFAIGADDVDHHILHLHGRACTHTSMIVSYRDYDRLYRRNDLYKLPFEFAQRIMIGGNPVLFVGLGMSEAEVNEALQDFVSNSPYQRMAPTFLLWNYHRRRSDLKTKKDWREVEKLRLERFHKLGVLTIFDVDLVPDDSSRRGKIVDLSDKAKWDKQEEARDAARICNLQWLIENVADHARRIAERENYTTAGKWRHMGEKTRTELGPVILWQVEKGQSGLRQPGDFEEAWKRLRKERLRASKARRFCIVGPQGCGHGSLAHALAEGASEFGFDSDNVLLVNGGFSFDTDSLLDGITRFLVARRDGDYLVGEDADPGSGQLAPGRPPRISRGHYFESLADLPAEKPLLIILSGMERFFSTTGDLLSAELDELLTIAAAGRIPGVTWLMLGTERVMRYMQRRGMRTIRSSELGLKPVEDEKQLPFERFEAIWRAFGGDKNRSIAHEAPAGHRLVTEAAKRFRKLSTSRISGDSAELRHAFYRLYLGKPFDEALGGDARLARELLRGLAFIGLPAEAEVLIHLPRIQLIKDEDTQSDAAFLARITTVLERLIELKLVIGLRGHGAAHNPLALRYTLPRTLLTELRQRFSVPLTEAKLSTAFNMSLYIAQPVDGFIPEPDIHDELGQIIDRLIGAYRDDAVLMSRGTSPRPILERWQPILAQVVKDVSAHERPPLTDEVARRDGAPKTLLTCELHALCSIEHAQRLRAALALVRGYYTTTDLLTLDVGDRLIREDRDGILLEHAERLDTLIDAYGKVAIARDKMRARAKECGLDFADDYGSVEPFYPDELVWLHNERGVVRLAMGDLIEASASFDRAFDVNRRHVERDDRAHNWRRIRLNQLTIDLETGEIGLALRKIEEILSVSEKKSMLREDELAVAIARGYRARARYLQGDVEGAQADYDVAIADLARLEEVRARAYFLRLRAELDRCGRAADIATALELATSTRQMDIVYRLRIMLALDELIGETEAGGSPNRNRALAQRKLDEAMRYALQTDMHRIRVEAGSALAETRLVAGDYEGALRSVSDALMVATRFGMELRKILLRSLMARIMARRGHPITALNLAMTTIKIASRRKYQPAIRHAEETLLSIPRVSAITDVIDASTRRQL